MATIQRNVKTFGTRNFVGEVAAAPSNYAPILSNEVDADLDTVYAAWNGGTDSVNLKDGSVTTAKIADAPNGISTVKLNDLAVTTPKLADAPNGVAAGKLNDLAVTTAKLADGAVTWAKLGALMYAQVQRATGLQTITHGTNVTLTYDTVDSNVGGVWSGAAPDRLSAPATGFYIVGGSILFDTSAGGTRRILHMIANGIFVGSAECSPGAPRYLTVAGGFLLAAGGFVQLAAYQDSGGGLGLLTPCRFWMARQA